MISLLPEFGIGIELSEHSLRAVAARTFWGRVQVVDHVEIDDLKTISAAECAETYRAFLKRNGLEAPWTVVAIPRKLFLYREIKLPATVIAELQSVMAMQVDSLHPFSNEEIVWDSAVTRSAGDGEDPRGSLASGSQNMVPVSAVVARKTIIEALAGWFKDRGIPVSQFAASPLLLRSIADTAPPNGSTTTVPVAVAYARDGMWEMLGVSESGALSSRVLDGGAQLSQSCDKVVEEVERALADLRLDESTQPLLLIGGEKALVEDVFAEMKGALGGHAQVRELEPGALAEAAARASIAKHRGSVLNLLPVDRRQFVPSMSLAPTYALAAIVLLLCVTMGVRGTIQDWLYSQRLSSEIRSLQPRISEIEAIRGQQRESYEQLLRLAGIRRAAKIPLEVLEDLTQSLPKDAWLQSVQMEGAVLTMSGSAASASGVLQAVSQAKTLESPQFLSAISRSNTGEESFRIGARLKLGMQ
jgi:Tfp pilus assembly protein PilN